MCLVGGDGHHALLVNHDAVALAKAATINLWVGQVLDLLVAYVQYLHVVSDNLCDCWDVSFCCHNLDAELLLPPVLS